MVFVVCVIEVDLESAGIGNVVAAGDLAHACNSRSYGQNFVVVSGVSRLLLPAWSILKLYVNSQFFDGHQGSV